MDNFPISFEDYLDSFSDHKGKRLQLRIIRLSRAIDYVWNHPNKPRALKYYHHRMSRFLLAINHNRLLNQRVLLKAQFVTDEDDVSENDPRETIVLEEGKLDDSFRRLEDLLIGKLPDGKARELERGMAVAVMTFFVVQLLRDADRIDYSVGDLSFPLTFYARVDNALSTCPERYAGTVLVHGERWKAVSDTPVEAGQECQIQARHGLTLVLRPSEAAVPGPED